MSLKDGVELESCFMHGAWTRAPSSREPKLLLFWLGIFTMATLSPLPKNEDVSFPPEFTMLLTLKNIMAHGKIGQLKVSRNLSFALTERETACLKTCVLFNYPWVHGLLRHSSSCKWGFPLSHFWILKISPFPDTSFYDARKLSPESIQFLSSTCLLGTSEVSLSLCSSHQLLLFWSLFLILYALSSFFLFTTTILLLFFLLHYLFHLCFDPNFDRFSFLKRS